LQYQNDQTSSSLTAFAFTVEYKGVAPSLLPPLPPDCSASDVDQIIIYVEPTAASLVINVSSSPNAEGLAQSVVLFSS
jgi:hypothetical protein